MRPAPAGGRRAVVGVPFLWLLVFFLVPFLVVAKISVSTMETASLRDLFQWDGLHLGNYLLLLQDDLYFTTFVSSLKYAARRRCCAWRSAIPFAYFMARRARSVQPALLLLVMLPFWTSFLLRVYAWKALLTEQGIAARAIEALGLDHVLAALGLIPGPGS
jgi:putrescine transport system permease protein